MVATVLRVYSEFFFCVCVLATEDSNVNLDVSSIDCCWPDVHATKQSMVMMLNVCILVGFGAHVFFVSSGSTITRHFVFYTRETQSRNLTIWMALLLCQHNSPFLLRPDKACTDPKRGV